MNPRQVAAKLREILDRADLEHDGLVNRKRSSKHGDEIEVLLENISLLVLDLRFDAAASRRELFEIRKILED